MRRQAIVSSSLKPLQYSPVAQDMSEEEQQKAREEALAHPEEEST